LNFKGSLDDFPRTVEYGRKVDTLRKRFREYLWDAEYCDTLGAEVIVDGKPYSRYTVFKDTRTGKHAVVVSNFERKKDRQSEIHFTNKNSLLVFVTPENQEPCETDGRLTISARSVVVIMEI
jgi:hypothetical protein